MEERFPAEAAATRAGPRLMSGFFSSSFRSAVVWFWEARVASSPAGVVAFFEMYFVASETRTGATWLTRSMVLVFDGFD